MTIKSRVARVSILGVILILLSFGISQWFISHLVPVYSQAPNTYMPQAGALYSYAVTGTTSLTQTAVSLTASGTNNGVTSGIVTGTRSIIGWQWEGAAGDCFVQVFDQYPASTVTVGTTNPTFAVPIQGSSSLGVFMAQYPVFTINSSLTVAATTTINGNTVCASPPKGFFIYK